MKFIATIIFGLALMLSTQSFAEGKGDSEGKKGERGNKGDMKAKMLKKFDANGDGKLDETEKAALKKAIAERKASGKGKKGKGKKGEGEKGGADPIRP